MGFTTELELPVLLNYRAPSEKAADKIRALLEARKQDQLTLHGPGTFPDHPLARISHFIPVPYPVQPRQEQPHDSYCPCLDRQDAGASLQAEKEQVVKENTVAGGALGALAGAVFGPLGLVVGAGIGACPGKQHQAEAVGVRGFWY